MQLTIDSSQPLDQVLRVVGALYNVELNASDLTGGVDVPSQRGRGSRRTAGASRPSSRRTGRRSGRATAGPSSETAAIRQWALEAGYKVGAKGRIPADVLTAYRDAH